LILWGGINVMAKPNIGADFPAAALRDIDGAAGKEPPAEYPGK